MMLIRFITSTRLDESDFFCKSMLAASLEALAPGTHFQLEPTFSATAGLAAVYNAAIDRAGDNELLVFVHDDVSFDDWQIGARLQEAMAVFDVVGVAGCTARSADQAAWWGTEVDGQMLRKEPLHGSGAIRHLRAKPGSGGLGARLAAWNRRCWRDRWTERAPGVYRPQTGTTASRTRSRSLNGAAKTEVFGPSPSAVQLLDGVLLAARAETLRKAAIRFDPRFTYHFYDLDFCRQCEQAGLSIGTWPIALTHASRGGWGEHWRAGKALYFEKWRC